MKNEVLYGGCRDFLFVITCLRSSSSALKFPATAVAKGDATDKPFGPEIAFATGLDDATPPSPAIAIPFGLACAIEDSSESSRLEGRPAKNLSQFKLDHD